MLRTLAINSNQIVLSFGVLIAFLSPKQSEIEESSLESLSKSRIQGVWDPVHYTRQPKAFHQAALPFTSGCRHFTPGCAAIYIRLRHHLHPAAAASTRMYYIQKSAATIPPGWEKRAFQLPWSDISGSADSTHPEDFATAKWGYGLRNGTHVPRGHFAGGGYGAAKLITTQKVLFHSL